MVVNSDVGSSCGSSNYAAGLLVPSSSIVLVHVVVHGAAGLQLVLSPEFETEGRKLCAELEVRRID